MVGDLAFLVKCVQNQEARQSSRPPAYKGSSRGHSRAGKGHEVFHGGHGHGRRSGSRAGSRARRSGWSCQAPSACVAAAAPHVEIVAPDMQQPENEKQLAELAEVELQDDVEEDCVAGFVGGLMGDALDDFLDEALDAMQTVDVSFLEPSIVEELQLPALSDLGSCSRRLVSFKRPLMSSAPREAPQEMMPMDCLPSEHVAPKLPPMSPSPEAVSEQSSAEESVFSSAVQAFASLWAAAREEAACSIQCRWRQVRQLKSSAPDALLKPVPPSAACSNASPRRSRHHLVRATDTQEAKLVPTAPQGPRPDRPGRRPCVESEGSQMVPMRPAGMPRGRRPDPARKAQAQEAVPPKLGPLCLRNAESMVEADLTAMELDLGVKPPADLDMPGEDAETGPMFVKTGPSFLPALTETWKPEAILRSSELDLSA
mmetsp:Transcript_81200/g.143175  ORF Transcript_81200/g.143175 Transcript_81200/m.143175 type:complete len:428 (+) Transcript_81200:69-1352(+)